MAKADGRASNGGAREGSGRPPRIAKHAWNLQNATANKKGLEALSESELTIALKCTEAALRDFAAEVMRRKKTVDE